MAKLERIYNIPVRKEFLRAPKHKRANRAVSAVRMFLQRHMKSDDVRLGSHINLAIWERGRKQPPHHVKVTAIKGDDNIVRAELFGVPVQEAKKEKKSKVQTLKEKITGAEKTEKVAETKSEEAKSESKPKKAKE
jgi:large subunit ribosomal protein L31e